MTQAPVTIELPRPPSVNGYLRHMELPLGGGRCPCCKRPMKSRVATLISADGRDWLRDVDRILFGLHLPVMQGPLSFSMMLHGGDRRAIDLDNFVKPTLDAMKCRPRDDKQTCWLFKDDSQFNHLEVTRGAIVPGGKAVVTVAPIAGAEIQTALFDGASHD